MRVARMQGYRLQSGRLGVRILPFSLFMEDVAQWQSGFGDASPFSLSDQLIRMTPKMHKNRLWVDWSRVFVTITMPLADSLRQFIHNPPLAAQHSRGPLETDHR